MVEGLGKYIHESLWYIFLLAMAVEYTDCASAEA